MLNGKENKEKEKKRMKDRNTWRKNGHVSKKSYRKVKDLSKKELRERREAVKLRVQKHRCTTKKLLEASKCDTSLTINSSTAFSPEPAFLVAMNFPKRGENQEKENGAVMIVSTKRSESYRMKNKLCKNPMQLFVEEFTE